MEYKIIHLLDSNFYEFEKLVNQEIKKGWTPLGGVQIKNTRFENSHDFFQSAVKK